MKPLQAYLVYEQKQYSKYSAESTALSSILALLKSANSLESILENKSLKIPTHLRGKLELVSLTDKQLIEFTFSAITPSKEEAYYKELSRRLFDDQLRFGLEEELQAASKKVQAEVTQRLLQLFQANLAILQNAALHYLQACKRKPEKNHGFHTRKDIVEMLYAKLLKPQSPNENDLSYTRNKLLDGMQWLHTKEKKISNFDKLQQEKTPAAKALLTAIAIVSAALVLPAICAMIYTSIRYGTAQFWKASNTTRLCQSITQAEKNLNVSMHRKR